MLRLWLLLVLVVTSQLSYGQLKSNISALNYGKVEVWKNDTLYIEIKNRSNTPAELLPTYNPSVELIGPRSIAPRSTQVYQVVAYPRTKGYFEFQPKFYFSNSNDPISFIIKGQIKKFDESALFQCPKLENTPKKFELPQIRIRVVDTFSHKIIYHAQSEFYNPLHKVQFDAGYMNVITHFGNYRLSSIAEGYEPKEIAFLFDQKNQEVIIQLKPIGMDEEDLDELIEKEGNDEEYITLEDVNQEKQEDEIEVIEKEEVEIIEEVTKEEVIKEKEPDKVIKLDTIWEIEIQEEENKEDLFLKLGDDYKKANLKPQHIIILADVSYSMQRAGYLDGLRNALFKTVEQLRPQDSLTIITFSSSNTVLADHIGIAQRDSIRDAIAGIKAKGGTNAKIALKSAYGVAKRYQSGNNAAHVILFTDGKFNTPGTPGSWYGSYVADKYIPASVQLSILSFSSNPSDMKFLKEISEKAAGNAEVIDQKIEVEVLQVLLRK
jgi:Ca-activated chloride channel family protein